MSRQHTHCGRGHALTPDNVYISPSGNRQCRICKLESNRAQKRGIKKDAPFTHCRRGHLFTEENTYIGANGKRFCKICQQERMKHDYIDRGGARAHYNLSQEEYDALVEKQHGECAICGKPFTARASGVIDHDHNTGKVRGILCTNCNTALGKFGDSPSLLQRAIDYLK